MTTSTIPAPMWTEAASAVDQAGRVLLVTHVNPDGDAIGSLLGLGNALRARGKAVDLAVDGGVPEFGEFLPGADTVIADLEAGEWDVMVSLDASDEERTGKAGAYGRAHSALVINVDHHPTNTLFGHLHVIMPTAPSTAEMVQEWLARVGQSLTPEIATPLLTGVITDTLGFRTNNVGPETLIRAAALMQAGAPLYDILQRTLVNKPYKAVQLWQRVLGTAALEDGVASAVITRDDWKAVGYSDETDAGLVGYLISTDEAKVAVVYKETENGSIEISLRSKPGWDVSAVAFSLGGGGHKQAAGATIDGPVEAARERVQPLLRAVVDGVAE